MNTEVIDYNKINEDEDNTNSKGENRAEFILVSSAMICMSPCFLIVFAGFFFVFICLPLSAIGVGSYLLALENFRQIRIDKFDRYVDLWSTSKRNETMKSSRKSTITTDNFGEIIPSEIHEVDVKSLNKKGDHPEIEDWNPFFFQVNHDFGPMKFDPSADPLSVTFKTVNESHRSLVFPFHESKTTVSCGSKNSCSQSEYRQKCENQGGEYFKSGSTSKNCIFRYRATRICVIVDPNIMRFRKSAVQSIEEIIMSSGDDYAPSVSCYKQQNIKYAKSYPYPEGYYELNSKTTQYDKFVVSIEVRSNYDPQVIMNYINDGKFDFGMSETEREIIALVLIIIGGVVILFSVFPGCFFCTILYCFCRFYCFRCVKKKKASEEDEFIEDFDEKYEYGKINDIREETYSYPTYQSPNTKINETKEENEEVSSENEPIVGNEKSKNDSILRVKDDENESKLKLTESMELYGHYYHTKDDDMIRNERDKEENSANRLNAMLSELYEDDR